MTPRVNFHFISVNFASRKNWLEIVEQGRKEKTTMKKRNVCQYMYLLETAQTKLEGETKVTGSPLLTLPGSLHDF